MTKYDYDDFCLTLNSCVSAVGRGKIDKATADIFYMRLSKYDLQDVLRALVESTDLCEHGYQYNVRLIKNTLEKRLSVNKFRSEALAMIGKQEQATKNLALYVESDEHKQSHKAGKESFKSCMELLNNEL